MSISKELLSEVLDRDVSPKTVNKNYLEYTAFSGTINNAINVYELAHKCKEWAYTKGFNLMVHKDNNIYKLFVCENMRSFAYDIETLTEPEAIFKACEWIRIQLTKDTK